MSRIGSCEHWANWIIIAAQIVNYYHGNKIISQIYHLLMMESNSGEECSVMAGRQPRLINYTDQGVHLWDRKVRETVCL